MRGGHIGKIQAQHRDPGNRPPSPPLSRAELSLFLLFFWPPSRSPSRVPSLSQISVGSCCEVGCYEEKGQRFFPWFTVILLLRGTHAPSYAHSAMLRAEDFLISFVVAEAGAKAGFLCNVHIYLRDEGLLPNQSICRLLVTT